MSFLDGINNSMLRGPGVLLMKLGLWEVAALPRYRVSIKIYCIFQPTQFPETQASSTFCAFSVKAFTIIN